MFPRYHIETFRGPNLQKVQNSANEYLEECSELEAEVRAVQLYEWESEYCLVITLYLPGPQRGNVQ